jgi:osomolarity two-component system response regulator SKN7
MARNHSGQSSPGLREIARADLLYSNNHYLSSPSTSAYPTRRATNGSATHLVPDTYPPHVPPHSESYLPDHSSSHPSHWPLDRRASTGSNSHQSILSHSDPGLKNAGVEDGMASTSDFVKKLYKMLEDQSVQHVVGWGPQGDCFVVKDMNEFTKSILPRMFKHSNFASFVRQLNKYDFHKVKNTDDNQYGEHSWTFRHPDFHADRRDALENIKRKVPTQRKSMTSSSRAMSTTPPGSYSSSSPLFVNFVPHRILQPCALPLTVFRSFPRFIY